MTKFKYKWMHTKKEVWGENFVECENERALLELLNEWNRKGNGLWVYFY